MTAFEFMANAFYICVGVTCLSVAALILYGVAAGIHNAIKGKEQDK